jgi:hypothetical protein
VHFHDQYFCPIKIGFTDADIISGCVLNRNLPARRSIHCIALKHFRRADGTVNMTVSKNCYDSVASAQIRSGNQLYFHDSLYLHDAVNLSFFHCFV